MVLGTTGPLVWCYCVIKKHKSSRHHTVSFRHDLHKYGSHDGSFVVIEGKEEVDCNFTNGNYKSSASVSNIRLS